MRQDSIYHFKQLQHNTFVTRSSAPFLGKNCNHLVPAWGALLDVHSTPSRPTNLTRPSEVATCSKVAAMMVVIRSQNYSSNGIIAATESLMQLTASMR